MLTLFTPWCFLHDFLNGLTFRSVLIGVDGQALVYCTDTRKSVSLCWEGRW